MKPQFITDVKGKKVSVVLPIKEYERIVMELEELDDIKLYDEAKSAKSNSMPAEKAFKLLDEKRRRRK